MQKYIYIDPEWKNSRKIPIQCDTCKESAIAQVTPHGLVDTRLIYFPCGHYQNVPPPERKKRTRKDKPGQMTLFEV